VAATHRDLAAAVAGGTFREDLYYRLKGVVLNTPRLDERGSDKALLAQIFLRRASAQTRFAPDALVWITQRRSPFRTWSLPPAKTLEQEVAALERQRILEALERTSHNHTHTARNLGLSRVGLLKKMDRMGLR